MFDRLRASVATGLEYFAATIADPDQRSPMASRVPYSQMTAAGMTVTPDTAVQNATVWACLRYISQTCAYLPWHLFKNGDKGPEVQSANPIDFLIWKRPSKEWSSFQFRETMIHWALRWGNAYAEIERNMAGRPAALWPIHPDRVRVCRDPATAELYYEVSNGTDGVVEIEAMNMFHLRGFGEGPVGVNVIHYAAQSIGWAQAIQMFGATFFGNGLNVAGVVINKKPLKPGGLDRQKKEFDGLYKGPRRSNKTAFIDNDADWKPVGTDPQKAQLTEANYFLVEEVCRWFGVPPHKVQHLLRATFANIESQAIEVVVDCLTPWVQRLQDEADYKLCGETNRQNLYTKINLNGLMRGDSAARIAFYQGMRNMGAFSVNRILELEDENTIGPDGDKHIVQSQYTTLEQIGEEPPPPSGGAAPFTKDANTDATPTPDDTTSNDGEGSSGANSDTQARVDRIGALLMEQPDYVEA